MEKILLAFLTGFKGSMIVLAALVGLIAPWVAIFLVVCAVAAIGGYVKGRYF